MVKVKADTDSVSISGKHGSASFSGDSASFSGKGGTISIGDPPPSGLEPIGDTGLYGTVSPIDPRDCEHYPDSPYCGGNPLSAKPIDLGLDIGMDGCSIHASVSPTLGFTKLPTQTFAYVKEECREEYEARKNPPKPPPPPPEEFGEWEDLQPQFAPPGFDANDIVIACTVTNYLRAGLVWDTETQDLKWFSRTYVGSFDLVELPSSEIAYYEQFAPAIGLFKGIGSVPGRNLTFNIHPQYPKAFEPNGWTTTNMGAIGKKNGNYIGVGTNVDGENTIAMPILLAFYYGRFGDIFPTPALPFSSSLEAAKGAVSAGSVVTCMQVCLAYLKKVGGGSQPDQKYKKNPPPTKRKKCCMSCCSPSQQRQNNDNALLRQVLKKLEIVDRKLGTYPFSVTLFDADDNKQGAQSKNVSVSNVARGQRLIVEREEKNAKSIGINEFPIYVPSTVVEDESNGLLGDLGDLKNKIFKQRIESVAELLAWKIKNDNEIYGKWQEYIEIEDSDPTKKGSQKKRVVLPNMARSFRELILLNSVQIKATGFILDAVLKMYIDLANTKVATATIEAIVRDIQDFLDYPTVERNLDIPLGIKIPSENDSPDDKEDIENFLQNSRVKAKFDDWTGEGSIHDMLVVLLDAASMIRAQMYGRGG